MKLSVCFFLAGAMIACNANAGFYVDEGLPIQTAAAVPAKPAPEFSIDIPFFSSRTALGPIASRTLQRNIEKFKSAEELVITVYSSVQASNAVQRQRATSVKSWLMVNGVPGDKVTFMEDMDSRKTNNNSVTVAAIQRRTAKLLVGQQLPQTTKVREFVPIVSQSMAASEPVSVKQSAINDPLKIALVQRIIELAQSKAVASDAAINILADVLKMQHGSAALSLSASTTQIMPTAVAVELPRTWTLNSKKTLRANLEEWARLAGWELVAWQPSNPYQINYTSTHNGTFLEVLGQVSDMVPALDFKAANAYRTLSVAESRKP